MRVFGEYWASSTEDENAVCHGANALAFWLDGA